MPGVRGHDEQIDGLVLAHAYDLGVGHATLDLGGPKNVTRVGLDCLQGQGGWIFLPRSVEFSVSTDGIGWREIGLVDIPVEADPERLAQNIAVAADGSAVQYVRVVARNQPLPDWHPGAGGDAWIFADEIVIEEA